MSETNFSAEEILEVMKMGGRIINKWKPRRYANYPEMLWLLMWPDGKQKKIQASALYALVGTGKIHTRALQGGLHAYYLPEEVQS